MTDSPTRDWSDVDSDSGTFADYLTTLTGLESIKNYKRRSYRLLRPELGDRVLDVGCGAGDDAFMLAEHVGPEGEVIGIDTSDSLIAKARKRIGNTDSVSFRHGDVMALEFADDSVDASRADRVLQHLDNPQGALAEMRRVTRPGGRITITDPDWATFVLDAPTVGEEVTRQVIDSRWADARNPAMGRQLYVLSRRAGLTDIEIDSSTIVSTDFQTANEVFYLDDRLETMQEANVLSADQADQWIDGLRRADADEMLFSSVTGFTVAGTVPPE